MWGIQMMLDSTIVHPLIRYSELHDLVFNFLCYFVDELLQACMWFLKLSHTKNWIEWFSGILNTAILLFFLNFILFLNFTNCISFAKYQNESTTGIHVFPILNPPPSSLPTIPMGRPSAPAPSIQYRASNLDWQLVSYMILYMFQCHSPKSSPPLPLQ